MKKYFLILFNVLLFTIIVSSCSKLSVDDSKNKNVSNNEFINIETANIYNDKNNWLNIPNNIDQKVDVFYVYPTVCSDPVMCKYTDPKMRSGAQFSFMGQATAFSGIANIFAPYYNQYNASFVLTKPLNEQSDLIEGIPTEDIMKAFQYYIENYNEGRPFILAGHSQGSNILLFLLQDYIKIHPEIKNRMIAAYIIGYSVTDEFLNKNGFKFTLNPDDIGVIISYNTEYSGYTGSINSNPVLQSGALATNPIIWKTKDYNKIDATQNLGSLIVDKSFKIISNDEKNYADATVIYDPIRQLEVVKCSSVKPDQLPSSGHFSEGVYHSFDYSFYYQNIKANANERIEKYFKLNSNQ